MTEHKLRARLPANRTLAGVLRHFEVESAIAERLRRAPREERARIYRTMYAELFAAVPDHPRLQRRESAEETERDNATKRALLAPFVGPATRLLEYGPGDCRFAIETAARVASVVGVDIADQIGASATAPANFRLVVYDGFAIDLPDASIDVAFSDQLLEHLHPDDVEDHFRTTLRLLDSGGVYVLRTPHRQGGPHDVSRYFCDEPRGFHLKEWTFAELAELLHRVGYARVQGFLPRHGTPRERSLAALCTAERVCAALPRAPRRWLARRAWRHIHLAAWK